MKALKQLQQHLGISFKFIHVVRNPYDNIATMFLRSLHKRPDADLGEKVIRYFTVSRPDMAGEVGGGEDSRSLQVQMPPPPPLAPLMQESFTKRRIRHPLWFFSGKE